MTNCYLLSNGFVSQIVITNIVVVSSAGVKRVVCNNEDPTCPRFLLFIIGELNNIMSRLNPVVTCLL